MVESVKSEVASLAHCFQVVEYTTKGVAGAEVGRGERYLTVLDRAGGIVVLGAAVRMPAVFLWIALAGALAL